MSTDRVNELRQTLRANRPDAPDIYQPVRDALARQDTALRANREPDVRTPTMGPRHLLWYTMILPGLLGLGAMACIVLPFARGGHELTWPRLLAGCAALGIIQIVGGYIAGSVIGRRRFRS